MCESVPTQPPTPPDRQSDAVRHAVQAIRLFAGADATQDTVRACLPWYRKAPLLTPQEMLLVEAAFPKDDTLVIRGEGEFISGPMPLDGVL